MFIAVITSRYGLTSHGECIFIRDPALRGVIQLNLFAEIAIYLIDEAVCAHSHQCIVRTVPLLVDEQDRRVAKATLQTASSGNHRPLDEAHRWCS